jgi:hypothetical protein
MAHLNQCLYWTQRSLKKFHSNIKLIFIYLFALMYGHKWTSMHDKNGKIGTTRGLWWDFITMFWIIEYLQSS